MNLYNGDRNGTPNIFLNLLLFSLIKKIKKRKEKYPSLDSDFFYSVFKIDIHALDMIKNSTLNVQKYKTK